MRVFFQKNMLPVVLLMSFVVSKGQQRVQFSQYMLNQYVLNPAVAGIDDAFELTLSYRKQWVDFDGGPMTYYFSGNVPYKPNKRPDRKKQEAAFHAFGLIAYKDRAGPVSKLTSMGSYAYNMPVTKKHRLALGAFIGVTDMRLDYNLLKFDQEGEVLNYPRITVPDGSLGLWFYNADFYIGASANQIFYNPVRFIGADGIGHLVLHYYITSGVRIPLQAVGPGGRNGRYLAPSIMLKYGGWGTTPSADVNLRMFLTDLFWIGTSCRLMDSQVFFAGIKWKMKMNGIMEFAYSYDLTYTQISSYTSGSHEITLKLYFYRTELICPSKFW